MGAAAVVSARNLAFSWPDGLTLWHGLDLDVPAGVSLLEGPEGCGKTTLLKVLAGEISGGSDGLTVSGVSLNADSLRYREQVFRTDPRAAMPDDLNASAWFAALAGRFSGLRLSALPELIEGFALSPHLDKPFYMLSTGSRRKVWLVAALASGAPLTLLDEPFAALDMPSVRFLTDCLAHAADHPTRAWIVAQHEPPPGITLASVIRLPAPGP